ncbi:hypothetical protein IP81_15820 [Novosphingobium sp. AAP83]|uniref:hypothetical protein n=1 Tax=Novosphingobium sp. AAP83 TaxID=1523425 RepID=UPI0006B96822|nr:hypothetical protein [Novosphingobium sp. AAP83]KPF90209.1 hypothetical protein IP81_15820 [Novosphingobium sp. AAP83]
MSDTVSPEAARILTLMIEETILPANWDVSGLWLDYAQQLAQYVADQRGIISMSDATMLVGLGGVLVEMAKREREACKEIGAFLRGEGGEHD